MKKTRIIDGVRLRLTVGIRYRASRPAFHGRTNRPMVEFLDRAAMFPITIESLNAKETEIKVIGPFNYERANQFLRAFNNGRLSITGRIWK